MFIVMQNLSERFRRLICHEICGMAFAEQSKILLFDCHCAAVYISWNLLNVQKMEFYDGNRSISICKFRKCLRYANFTMSMNQWKIQLPYEAVMKNVVVDCDIKISWVKFQKKFVSTCLLFNQPASQLVTSTRTKKRTKFANKVLEEIFQGMKQVETTRTELQSIFEIQFEIFERIFNSPLQVIKAWSAHSRHRHQPCKLLSTFTWTWRD